MTKTIEEYTLASALLPSDLFHEVNDFIKRGYVPLGGVFKWTPDRVTAEQLFQPMVKYKD